MTIKLSGPSRGWQVGHNSHKHIIHQHWLIKTRWWLFAQSFDSFALFFIHLKTLKYSFYFPYGFCFFFTTWLQLKFTKPTFSLPPHQVLRDKKQCMTRLEWLHPAKANTQSYGNDWGVVFNKGASQRNPYKPEKLHHWHCVYNIWYSFIQGVLQTS